MITELKCCHLLSFQVEDYPPSSEVAALTTLSVSSIEVLDRIKNSEIDKLFTEYTTRRNPKRENSPMVYAKLVKFRPHPAEHIDEYSILVSVSNLRLNIDQDAMFFIIDFARSLIPGMSAGKCILPDARERNMFDIKKKKVC